MRGRLVGWVRRRSYFGHGRDERSRFCRDRQRRREMMWQRRVCSSFSDWRVRKRMRSRCDVWGSWNVRVVRQPNGGSDEDWRSGREQGVRIRLSCGGRDGSVRLLRYFWMSGNRAMRMRRGSGMMHRCGGPREGRKSGRGCLLGGGCMRRRL
jgi:hypothetical protein